MFQKIKFDIPVLYVKITFEAIISVIETLYLRVLNH